MEIPQTLQCKLYPAALGRIERGRIDLRRVLRLDLAARPAAVEPESAPAVRARGLAHRSTNSARPARAIPASGRGLQRWRSAGRSTPSRDQGSPHATCRRRQRRAARGRSRPSRAAARRQGRRGDCRPAAASSRTRSVPPCRVAAPNPSIPARPPRPERPPRTSTGAQRSLVSAHRSGAPDALPPAERTAGRQTAPHSRRRRSRCGCPAWRTLRHPRPRSPSRCGRCWGR